MPTPPAGPGPAASAPAASAPAASAPAASAHVAADQGEVLAFLASAGAHGAAAPPRRIDTHGAVVFLAGDDVYKLKRAVLFPFMDLSTLEKRRAACEAEIAVNRANAPGLYLGAVPVSRGPAGLAIGGDGEPVEWLVHMRRFDEEQTLDRVAGRGGLDPALLAGLADAVLAAHRIAPVRDGEPAARALRAYVGQNEAAFAENASLFPPGEARRLGEATRREIGRHWPLLLARGEAGFVRRCHGDLHLRNVALIGGRPVLFDAIEFDEAVATCDLLYDLAFLLMDLWERGLRREASLVLNRYLWGSDDRHLDGLAALPLFLSLRAAIRAKVVAASLPHLGGAEREARRGEALRYFRAASAFLAADPPRLVAIGGLSGSGKTTLAAALAPHLGRAPGAVHLRSDVERKRMAGIAETERLPASAYTRESSEAVYARLLALAARALGAGQAVVVDAVHARPEERDAVERLAVPPLRFDGLWLDAPAGTLVERVGARRGDASDADAGIVRRQSAYDLGDIGWTRIAAGDGPGPVLAAALDAVGLRVPDA